MNVDRKGTVAAAATVVAIEATAIVANFPIKMTVNRSFVVLVILRPSETSPLPLFTAVVNNVQ